MPEGKRPRKPGSIVRDISGYTDYVGCGCGPSERQHDTRHVKLCARAHFASLIRELRASLRSRP